MIHALGAASRKASRIALLHVPGGSPRTEPQPVAVGASAGHQACYRRGAALECSEAIWLPHGR